MVYCIVGFSYTPELHPQFTPINEDGSDFVFERPTAPSGYELPWNLNGGFRLTSQTSPTLSSVYQFAILESQHETLPNMFRLPGPVPCVNQLVRDCVEFLEPNIHQFFPITLLKAMGEAFDGSYYMLNICTMLNSLIFDKTSLRLKSAGSGRSYVAESSRSAIRRTVKGSVVGNHHLWREKTYPNDIYISDALFEAFQKNKFRGIEQHNYIKVTIES